MFLTTAQIKERSGSSIATKVREAFGKGKFPNSYKDGKVLKIYIDDYNSWIRTRKSRSKKLHGRGC